MKETKTVQVTWLNGKEFRKITWRHPLGMTVTSVTVVWAVWKHRNSSVMEATLMGRVVR